nr:MAG: putative RNA-dependent RNA polymerase [Narnaviridae sp.]
MPRVCKDSAKPDVQLKDGQYGRLSAKGSKKSDSKALECRRTEIQNTQSDGGRGSLTTPAAAPPRRWSPQAVALDYNYWRAEGFLPEEIPACVADYVVQHGPDLDESWMWLLLSAVVFCRSLQDTMIDADPLFERMPVQDYFKVLSTLLKATSDLQQVQWMKHLKDWPLAKFLRNDLPEVPEGFSDTLGGSWMQLPLTGPTRRHFKNLLASRTRETRAACVMFAISQGVKRGTLEVPDSFKNHTMEKHRKALTKVIPDLEPEIAEKFTQKFDQIWGDPVFRKGMLTVKTPGEFKQLLAETMPVQVGTNACCEAKRSEGGKASAARVFATTHYGLSSFGKHYWENEVCQQEGDELWEGWRDYRAVQVNGRSTLRHVLPYTSRYYTDRYLQKGRFFHFQERHLIRIRWSINRGMEEEYFDHFGYIPELPYHTIRDHALNIIMNRPDGLSAKVALCLEPLKCRTITKGECLPYWAAQVHQKRMWKRLQAFPQFALTGQTLNTSHLQWVVEATAALVGEEFDLWVSGDYSAATDGLSQHINRLCLDSYLRCSGADPEDAELCRAVLGNHLVQYPEGSPFADDPVKMTCGQLMGSPLSFPVLCLINVACYWLALEEYLECQVERMELPVLVNGDDICFKANQAFYGVWKKWTERGGFTLSQGKNFIARDFVTINSKGFTVLPSTATGSRSYGFKRHGFLQTGLLYHGEASRREQGPMCTKIGTDRPDKFEQPFHQKVNDILSSANSPKRALLRVFHFYRDAIREHTRNGELNLFAPQELGGLGIQLPEGASTRFTAWQQKVAGYLLHCWKTGNVGEEANLTDAERASFPPDARVVDLNGSLTPGGVVSYKSDKKPLARPVFRNRIGMVVTRDRNEPEREFERKVEPVQGHLLNYTYPLDDEQGAWKIAYLSKGTLDACRSYEGSGILEPLVFNLEARVLLAKELNVDGRRAVELLPPTEEVVVERYVDSAGRVIPGLGQW